MRTRSRAVAALVLAAAVGLVPGTGAPTSAAPAPNPAPNSEAGRIVAQVDPVTTSTPASPSLPPSALAARDAVLARLGGAVHLHGSRGVIDGSVYQCAPTVFDEWLSGSVAEFTAADRATIADLDIDMLPAYEALFFGTAHDPQYALNALNADAQRLARTARTTRTFGDVDLSDVQVLAMHGSMLTDHDRVARVYREVYGLPPASADDYADLVVEFISSAPKFEGGNHPSFTLNAFAYTDFGQEVAGFGRVGDKIVMGDGILRAYRELGFGDVAPQAILAHEFAHHVQFETGVITGGQPASPESTRRTELHADALAAYYLSHPRGESMQWKRVQQFLQVFFSIGDCGFAGTGHHGTPNQRMRAAQWGYEQQENARPRGHVLPAATLTRGFDAALPDIVRPDA